MRSFMSSFAAFAIRASGTKKTYANPAKREKYIQKLRVKNARPFNLPPYLYRSNPEQVEVDGVEVVYFGSGSEKKIIYLHGGAYCEPPLLPHFMLCDRLADETGYGIIFPIYKKAPDYTFEDSYAFLDGLSKALLETTTPEDLVFMGDSSGGGLALGFCAYLNETDRPMPSRLILLSPWLDASMDTPFDPGIEKVDPNLQYDFLKLAGENWAGETDVHDYRISPTYYEKLAELPPMTIYYGTFENILADGRAFRDKCEAAGAQLDYREYEEMNHDFVLYPIPEAKQAQNEIIDLLNGDYDD